jgi:hypothetical protein
MSFVKLSIEESVILAKLTSQGCSLDTSVSTEISIAIRYGRRLFFVPRDEGDCYQPAHFQKIANEVERWGLELLPLDYHICAASADL